MSGAGGGSASGSPPLDRVVIGSRRSELARVQARRVADALRRAWPELEVEMIGLVTEGDRVLDRPLAEIGGKGLFTAELEAALLDGRVDMAVHSLKDLPTDMGPEFAVLGVPERADFRDVLLGPAGPLGLEGLEPDSVVGTSSLRRKAQLLAARPDCRVREIRGNVETRVEKMRDGRYDAVILAAAGLRRLGLLEEESGGPFLEDPEWLPAPGQGTLGIEGRKDDEDVRALVAAIESREVRAATTAERSLLEILQGGCMVPVGALGRVDGGELLLEAAVLSPEGTASVRASGKGPLEGAGEVGREVGRDLLRNGAEEILADLEGT